SSATEVVAGLVERLIESAGRTGSEQVSTLRLATAIRHFAGPTSGIVLDPACGIGSLLLAVGKGSDAALAGQEINPTAARLATSRAVLDGHSDVTIHIGDSLREDRWPALRADLVLCDPPVNAPDWGREDLLLDARW